MKRRVDELLGYENLKIIQTDECFSFSLDSMLLADFITVKGKERNIIELGCGNAPILLYLTLKTSSKLIGVEIQNEVAQLALDSVKINNLEHQIEIINADFRNIHKKYLINSFDVVYINPPFFEYHESSNINKTINKSIARHEIMMKLEDVFIESSKLLKVGGYLYMIHRVDRLDQIISFANKYKFGLLNMKFVYSKTSDEKALSFLVQMRYNKMSNVKVLRHIDVYDANSYTSQLLKIFKFKEGKNVT